MCVWWFISLTLWDEQRGDDGSLIDFGPPPPFERIMATVKRISSLQWVGEI